MSNEEKASEIVIKIQNSSHLDYDGRRAKYMYESMIEIAKWKDEQFVAEKQALIDNACEWLESKGTKHIGFNVITEEPSLDLDFTELFRKAMEEIK